VVIGITGASTFSSHGVGHASLLATAGLVTAIVSGTLPETKTNLGRKVPNAGMAALDWATLFQLLGYVPHDHDHDHDHDGARRSRALPFYQARCGHMKGLAAGPAPTPARGPVGRPPGAPRHLVRDARHRTSPRASPGGAGALMRPNLTYAVKEHLDTEVRRTRRPAPPKRQPFTAADPCGARPGSTAPMAQHLLTFGSYWQPA